MILTIGYEKSELGDFLETLSANNVSLLIDVRDRAQSRKRGFSKTALSLALADLEIGYLHLRDLGDPKEGREAARAGKFDLFRRIYGRVLKTPSAIRSINEIVEASEFHTVCLLCYEQDEKDCHRKLISDSIHETYGVQSKHLRVGRVGAAGKQRRRVSYPRESIAA